MKRKLLSKFTSSKTKKQKNVIQPSGNKINMKKSFKLKKSFVWFSVISQATVPLMLSFTPVVQANISKKKNEYETANEAVASNNGAQTLTNKMVNSITQTTENYLNQFGSAKIDINLDKDFDFKDATADALVALTESESALTFGQVGAVINDDRQTVNLGLGQRHFFNDQMLGYNAFLDHELSDGHTRVGVGAEYAVNYLKGSANGYFGTSSWEKSDVTDLSEKAADGYDVRLEGYLPFAPQFGAKLMYEQYFGDNVNLFGDSLTQRDPSAVTVGLNYTPIPLLTLGADHKMGQNGLDETEFTVGLNIAFGQSIESQLNPANVADKRKLTGQRYDLVDRNNEIVLDKKMSERLSVYVPSFLGGVEGEGHILDIRVSGAKGALKYQWNADEFFAAGGQIIDNNGQIEFIFPAHNPNGNNTYNVGLMVIDSEGNRSGLNNIQIDVKDDVNNNIKVDIPSVTDKPSFSEEGFTITGNNAIANGLDKAVVSIPVLDGSGKPMAGQNVIFTITNPDGSISTKTVVTDANGNATIEVTQTMPGDVNIVASIGGNSVESNLTFLPDTSDLKIGKAGIAVAGDNLVANGRDVATVTLPVVDANGNPIVGQEVVFIITNPDGSTSLKKAITDANGVATIEVSQTQAGETTISTTVGGQKVESKVSYAPDASTAQVGQPGMTVAGDNLVANGSDVAKVTLPVVDANGNPIVGKEVVFTITNPDGTTSTKTAVTDANGIATIEVSQTQAGETTISTTVGGQKVESKVSYAPDASTAQVGQPGMTVAGDNLVANGSDVAKVTLPVVDANGNPIVGQEVVFTITNPDGTTSTKTAVTDANGIATIEVSQTQAGETTISTTVGGQAVESKVSYAPDASTAQVGQPGMTVVGDNLVANGSDVAKVTLPVVDANGNPIVGKEVVFTITNPDGTTSTKTAVTDANGIATIEVSQTQAGETTISTTVGGQAVESKVSYAPDASTAQVGQPGMTVVGDNLVANGSDVAKVTLPVVDANGNPIVGKEVVFTITNPDGTTSTKTAVTDANGIATIEVSQTQAGETTISTTVGGQAVESKVSYAPDASTATVGQPGMTVVGDNLVANGSDVAKVTLPVVDANGNPIVGKEVVFTITNPDGTTSTKTAVTDANGIATIEVSQTQAGETTISTTVGGQAVESKVSYAPDASTATVGQPGMTVVGDNLVANGSDVAKVTLPVVDANGNPIVGQEVVFTITNPDGTTSTKTAVTDANGIATIEVSQTQAGETTISTTVGGQAVESKVNYAPDASTAQVGQPGMTVVGDNLVANGSDVAKVTLPVVDANGNPIVGKEVVFTITNPDGTTSTKTAVTDANGIATIEVSQTQAGETTISTTVGGQAVESKVSYAPDASTATVGQPGMTVVGDNLVANGSDVAKVTLPVVDANGNPIVGKEVVFTITNPDGTTSTKTAVTDANGIATIEVSQTQAGETTISTTVGGQAVESKVSYAPDASTAQVGQPGMTVVGDNLVANGSDVAQVTLPVVDANGNPIVGKEVVFTITNPDGTTSTKTAVTDANGIATIEVSQTQAGETTISTTVGGQAVESKVSYAPDASTATVGQPGMTVVGDNLVANGSDVAKVTLPVVDANGNPIVGKEVVFTITNPDGTTSTKTAVTDANGIATIEVSQTQAGETTISTTVGGQAVESKVSYAPDASTAQVGQPGMTVVGDNLVANGSDVAKVTLPVVDANGNPIVGKEVVFTITNPDGTTSTKTAVTDANGIATIEVSQTQAGETTISTTVGGQKVESKVSYAPDASTADFVGGYMQATKNGSVADNLTANIVKVKIVDANNNAVPNLDVTFTGSDATLVFANGGVVKTDAEGIAFIDITTTKAGTFNITAKVSNKGATVPVTFIAGPIDPSKSSLTLSTAVITTDPTSSTVLTASLQDKFGNVIDGRNVTFKPVSNLAVGDYSVSSTTQGGNGIYSASFKVSRTRSTSLGGISTDVKVYVDNADVSIAAKNVTVDRAFIVKNSESGLVNEQPITATQMLNILNQSESVSLTMQNGFYAPRIDLPANAPKGASVKIVGKTTFTTILNYGTTSISIDENQNTSTQYVFDGTNWNRL